MQSKHIKYLYSVQHSIVFGPLCQHVYKHKNIFYPDFYSSDDATSEKYGYFYLTERL